MVVAVAFGDPDAGGSVNSWETVSVDVWLVVVVWGGWLGWASSVLLAVSGEVEGGGDDDIFSEVIWCFVVWGCDVLLVVFTVDELTSGVFFTVEPVRFAALVVNSAARWAAEEVPIVPAHEQIVKTAWDF